MNVIDSSKEPATFIFLRSPDVCDGLAPDTWSANQSPPLVSASSFARRWRLPATTRILHSRLKAE